MTEASQRALEGLRDWSTVQGYSIPLLAVVFCVAIEIGLNIGGHLVWEYAFWNRSFGGVWLIFLFGYLHFYVAIILVLSLRQMKHRLVAVGSIWGVAILMNLFGMGIMGWTY
jgi:hypothetical protein